MQVIINLHPVVGSQMEAVRDLFVFQMFTGLAYSDTQAFDIADYHKDGDIWIANGKRIKTGVPYVSVLLPPVIDVLSRHNWQTPKICNQKYNALLKTMGTVIGIEHLHTHLARHTFATYMLSNNVKVENLMRMLGHKNINQTMRYAKVLAKDVQSDFEMIGSKLSLQKK
jgi:integrase